MSFVAAPLDAQTSAAAPGRRAPLDSTTMAAFRWRPVGPANMGGRIGDVAGIPAPSKTFYVATVAGGIYKTTNAGTSFRSVFDDQRVVSMGALAIAPSDTNVVYAGTGEQNSRNSISPGGGIYKTTDGAKTWQFVGLAETQQIGRIVVHPNDPNTVWVAALGHAWGPNKERGLYKTTDGGKNWRLVKFIDERTGFVDIVIHPTNPNVLWASSYQRVRGPYFLKSGGPGSALWKSTDGGETWAEVKGGGFPETTKGRIGLAVSRSNPDVVYALVEADSVRGKDAASRTPQPASDSLNPRARKIQRLLSGLYRSADGGKTWRWMSDRDVRPFYYSQVRVDPKNPDRVYWSSTPVQFSDDGGKTARTATNGIHVDHHAMWIDPNDPEHFIVGNDGGVSQTWDRGGNYDFLDVLAISQPYEVSYNMSVPYRVCVGLQDNGSWCGPSRTKGGSISNEDWITVGGGDGFYTAQDPSDPDVVYSESQGGNIGRYDLRTGERTAISKPTWRPRYIQFEDSIIVERGDTTKPASKAQQQRVAALRSRQKEDSVSLNLRFNWNTPFFLSPHAPATLYIGANRVLKSTNRGDNIVPISPDLSRQQRAKIAYSVDSTGGISLDATGAETYGTIVALAESPIRPGILFAGTDDGNVWVTRNDGATWEDLSKRFPGAPAESYLARIEPSHFDSNTVYVAFDNHRNNDFTPYLYVSTDFGKTFRSIAAGLPTGGPDFLHVVREDPVNRDLLFVGTDVAAYVSRDRGQSWQKFMNGLGTGPVHDLQIHPRDHELIAATHGRSVWIVDIAPLEQLNDSVMTAGAYLFAPKTAYQYGETPGADGSPGHKRYQANTPAYGAEIAYRLTSGNARDRAKLVITNVRGDTVRSIDGPGGPGLHRVNWDFRGKTPPASPLSPAQKRDSIVNLRKLDRIIDSMVTAGAGTREELERIKTQINSGGDLFRRRGGGGQPNRFNERPGEGPMPGGPRRAGADTTGRAGRDTTARDTTARDTTARDTTARDTARAGRDTTAAGRRRAPGDTTARGRRGGPGAGGETAAEGEINQDLLGDVFSAMRRAGIQTAGGGFGRGGPPVVESGDYLVTLSVGDRKLQQVLRVERTANAPAGSVRPEDEDEEEMDLGPLPSGEEVDPVRR
jgi:photosystem II stability/assembly factor-like uncharacterized protein